MLLHDGLGVPFSFITTQVQNPSAPIDGNFHGVARARDLDARVWLVDAQSLRFLLLAVYFTGSGSDSAAGHGCVLRVAPCDSTAGAPPFGELLPDAFGGAFPAVACGDPRSSSSILARHAAGRSCARIPIRTALQPGHPSVRPCASKSDSFKCASLACPVPAGGFGRISSVGSRSRSVPSPLASCLLPGRSQGQTGRLTVSPGGQPFCLKLPSYSPLDFER